MSDPTVQLEIVQPEGPAIVRVNLGGKHSSSVLLHFAGGTGTVLAALAGFIGNVVVEDNLVSNVGYVPSKKGPRYSDYEHDSIRLEKLRAAVAAAARFGVFRIEGTRVQRSQSATELLEKSRVLKGIDPALGIYAAYAYNDADVIELIRSVRNLLRDDLQSDLFDVALLVGALSKNVQDLSIAPFCPMLSQGWGLLRVKEVKLHPLTEESRSHLVPALWTTLTTEGIKILTSGLEAGYLH